MSEPEKDSASADKVEKLLNQAEEQTAVDEGESLVELTAQSHGGEPDSEHSAKVELLSIDSHVGYDTGNLDFSGRVHIKGSVRTGYSVKAGNAITIVGMIEPGALVQAQGDINVGQGIIGKKTCVVASGTVRAQYIEEATVQAVDDILLSSHAYKALLQSGGRVHIAKGEGQRGGSAISCQIWARKGLEAYTVAVQGTTPTVLTAGLSQAQGEKLKKIKEALDTSYSQIMRFLERLGVTRADPGEITSMINASTGARRTLLVNTAQRLAKIVKLYENLLTAQKSLEKAIAPHAQKAEIVIHEKASPGVVVRIGQHQRKLADMVGAPCFCLVDNELVNKNES